jgi:hypothetical protein
MATGIATSSRRLMLSLVISLAAQAQMNCPHGGRLEGDVVDPTGAVIPGARVSWSQGGSVASDQTGHYILTCAMEGEGQLTVEAPNFATLTQQVRVRAGIIQRQKLTLALAAIQTEVRVNANSSPESSATESISLNTEQVQQLPDDPDDLLAQLQILAAEYGGDPTTARVMVDGFQNSSALPPKSSIASIRINPDFFSSEYQWPPYGGGTIEITTKPGTSALHGALFFTGSPGAVNATDPFSLTPTPASRERYGFEFSDRLIPQRSDISLALEKRDIDEFNVVNAQTLGSNGEAVPLQQTVTAPQRLWIASTRNGWQFGPKDSGFISFAANVNNTQNQGVGGLVLPEAGYTATVGEYDLRLSNTFIASPNLLHETRVGYTWKRNETVPNNTAASLQIAGYFTGGGALTQNRNDRERDLEVDDDAVWTRGRHTLKFGVQSLSYFVHDFNPNTFNGTFIFGGASAPVLDENGSSTGQTTTITSLEQYRRALAGLPGGTPTTYEVVTGQPLVTYLQWNVGLYLEETFKLSQRFTVAGGLRYQIQTSPDTFANFEPRFGFDWAMNKKSTWLLHAHAGFFNDTNSIQEIGDGFRLNGILQTQHNVYSPSFTNPLTPFAGSIATTTVQRFAPSMTQKSTFNLYLNVEHIFAHQWAARVNYYLGEDWNRLVLLNINAPFVASSNNTVPDPTAALLAPRPGPPNENIMQYQNSGHLNWDLLSVTLNQHSYKWFGLSTYYRHAHFKSDGGTGVSSPQSSYSDQGESSRADWLRSDAGTLTGNLIFPKKIDADVQFYGATGAAFNILTGTDNNGDGDFNDRPAYATAPGAGVYSTPYGLLTANAVNGNVPRNAGTMPPLFRFALNLNRSFTLNPGDNDHPRTLSFNARTANLLNHTNVTSVNQVLSTTLGQPTVAEPARRIDFGARFEF